LLAHLRAGGVTPWSQWHGSAEPNGPFLPGAQQLELLRRVNQRGPVEHDLAERILSASAPGRGRPDLELLGAEVPSKFGPRPVDPSNLPADELIRVATSVLADQIVATGLPAPAPERLIRPTGRAIVRPRTFRRSYRLLGDPWIVDPIRANLGRRGYPSGGVRPLVLIVGARLDLMLSHTFTTRCFEGGVSAWGPWLRDLKRTDRLAARVDLAAVAKRWAEREGTNRIRIVTDQDRIAPLVRTKVSLGRPMIAPEAVELTRRLGTVLGLLVEPPLRARLLRDTLGPHVRQRRLGDPIFAIPAEHQEWVRDQARRMQNALHRGGYAVEGSLDALLPDFDRPGHRPGAAGRQDDEVLALAIELMRERWES